METSGDASNNWIPTSFSGTSETGMETGDSLSSYQSAATPGSAVAIDQQSIDDLSFDAISRQKLSLTGLGTVPEPTSPKNNNNAPPGMFEEDTRSSWSGEPPKPTTFKETALDGEDSQNSVASNSQKSAPEAQLPASTSPKQDNVEEEEVEKVVSFPPENLFEYMWPQESNEFFFLQEQVSDYLNVKSFKRKYPDLVRRSVDMAEKQFLKDRGVVTEVQCDLGLTALRSEEVLELMNKDYPDQYKEYIRVLREKEQQSIKEKRIEYIATNSDKTRMVDLVKKAVQSAAEYNAHLNQERREERKSCMDLQTYTVHYPCKTSTKMKETPKMGKYPVALLPGQFQDFYKQYSPDELKYLPINTVLYGPLKELNSVKASASDGSPSDSDDSSASEESCDSSSRDSSSAASEPEKTGSKPSNGKPDAVCKVCKRGPELNRELVHCADCDSSAHPNCIELTADVVDVLKTYPWQCMDCKVCSHCKDPDDEDRMLFCDICDRGYHTFCVGLKTLPQQGKWVCRKCGSCSLCGAAKPGPESATKTAQWQYEAESDPNRRPKIFCQACFKKRR